MHFFFYALLMLLNILPVIPLSLKGASGVLFIIIGCLRLNSKTGLITATMCTVLGFINFLQKIDSYHTKSLIILIFGSILYYIIALVMGGFVETIKNKTDALTQEIHRREKTEKELKEKLTLLQSLMDTIPSPIFFKDLEHKYIGCNPAFETALGISFSEIIGRTAVEIADEELAKLYHSKDIELMNTLCKQIYEAKVKFADGTMRDVIFSKAIFYNESGAPSGIVGVMTDITDKNEAKMLKQTVEEKKQIIDEILENDKMKTEFFSNISHELRTPLNLILSSTQLTELYLKSSDNFDNKDKIERNIATMRQNCYRLLRLVNNLIDISKIDAKAFEVHLRNCNIISVIEEITLSVSDYIENKGLSLVFDTAIEEKIMACDDEKIERILLNLLSNAVKFTPKGGEIFVSISPHEDSLCIKVQDTGVGIPIEKQSQIFQRFCQIDRIFTRQHEGSGIGLNLVKSLVELHGGTITFDSKEGKGTSFTINLPCKILVEDIKENKNLAKQTPIEKIKVEFSDIYSIGYGA